MNICAILAKYNPYSNCHLYHAAKTRAQNADAVIAVMAGSVLNSGEPCAAKRAERAEWAVAAGVDCVVELPLVYCVSDFENYVAGFAKTLSPLKTFSLSFGSEFSDASDILNFNAQRRLESIEHGRLFSDFLQEDKAVGEPVRHKKSKIPQNESKPIVDRGGEKFYGEKDSQESMFLHFCGEAKRLRLNVDYRAVKKIQNSKNFLPSEQILQRFYNGKDIWDFVPPHVKFFGIDIKKFEALCLFAVNSKPADELCRTLNFSDALAQRILKAKPSKYSELLDLSGGGIPRAQIARAAVCAALGVQKKHLELARTLPPYLRVVAYKKGREDILDYLKSKTPNVFYNATEYPSKIRSVAELDDKADKLINLIKLSGAVCADNIIPR
jgi:predicted nucleotidyltransferase